MKSLEVDVPDALAREVEQVVRSGWFGREEVVCAALLDFVQRQRFALVERQQRDDIAWALRQTRPDPAA